MFLFYFIYQEREEWEHQLDRDLAFVDKTSITMCTLQWLSSTDGKDLYQNTILIALYHLPAIANVDESEESFRAN